MPFTFWSSAAGLLLACLCLGACARPAPELPPDYGSVEAQHKLHADNFTQEDLALSCADIAAERQRLIGQSDVAEAEIVGDRWKNQAALLRSGWGLPASPNVQVDRNEAEVALLDANQRRLDRLMELQRFKGCETPGQPD